MLTRLPAQVASDFELILNAADKAGVMVMLFVFILALHKGWIVLGKPHAECLSEKATLRETLDTKAVKAEADLERLRAEREATYGSS